MGAWTMSTSGILIIGNEILSGKVRDENLPYLLPELRKLGVSRTLDFVRTQLHVDR